MPFWIAFFSGEIIPNPIAKSLSSLLAVAFTLSIPSLLWGQATWIGVGSSGTPAAWSAAGNWTGTAPTNNSTINGLIFSNSVNSWSNNDLTGLTINGINYPSIVPTRDNTLSGNAFTLSGNVTVDTGNFQTIGNAVALSGNRGFAVNSGRLTLSGNLGDGVSAGGILKTGVGTLMLQGTGSMSGVSTQTVTAGTPGAGTYNLPLVFNASNAGTVILQNSSALGDSTRAIQFNSGGGGTLDLQTNTSMNGYSIFAGSGGTANTIIANRLNAGVGVIHNLGIAQLGSTTLTINQGGNVNSGVGGVSFNAISLTAGNNDRPVLLNGSASISVGSVATTANANNNRTLGLAGTNVNNSVTGVIANLATGVTGSSVLSLAKSESSTWTLTGANTYTGTTTVSGGVLQLGNGGTSGSLSTSSAITNNATLAINRSNGVTQGVDFASTIAGSGSLIKSGTGNLVLTGSNLSAGTAREVLLFAGSNAGTVTLNNTAALGAAGNTVRFSGGGSGILDMQTDTSMNALNISSGTGNGGTLIVNRATSGAGITHSLGVLDFSSVTLTANTGSNVTSGIAGVSFSELRLSGGNDNNPVTLTGSATYSIGSASINSTGISKRLQLDGSSLGNVIGAISNTNNNTIGSLVNVIKSGSSTWTLSANNSFTGSTTVSAGTLVLGSGSATGNLAGTSSITNNATLSINRNNIFTQAIDLNNRSISGSGAVVQSGNGTTVFTAANSYSGGTSVLSGTLTVDNAKGSGTGTGLVTVAGGATLNGSGTIGGAVTFQSGAQHNPGNSPGIQTFESGITYDSGSIFNWELNKNSNLSTDRGLTGYDGVNVTGGNLVIQSGAISNLIFNSSSSVLWSDSFWDSDRRWAVFENTGAQVSPTGIFTTVNVSTDSIGQTLLASRGSFSWSQDSNDLYLQYTAVPEPSTLISSGVLLAVSLFFRQRRKMKTLQLK